MGSEDQDLTTHTKKTKRDHHHSKGKPYHSIRYWPTVRCYTCDEKGHISKFCPNKGNSKKKNGSKRRHHAHAAEDDEPSTKKIRQESDSSSDEEYVLISTLTGTIFTWKQRLAHRQWCFQAYDGIQRIICEAI